MSDRNHLVMIEIGPRFAQAAAEAAQTLPFAREDATDRVLLVAPIEDEPASVPVETERSAPDARLEVRAPIFVPEPMAPVALAACVNLVAHERRPGWLRTGRRRAVDGPGSRFVDAAVACACLLGSLGAGIGLAFLIAAVAN